ncbi:hypothetical protein GGI23_001515, partial [Coemansia sp. RSA 2559]
KSLGAGNITTIITDAGAALAKAINDEMPGVNHLLCGFHKMCNFSKPIASIKVNAQEKILQMLDPKLAAVYNPCPPTSCSVFFFNAIK